MNEKLVFYTSDSLTEPLAEITTIIIDEDYFPLSSLKECSALKNLHVRNTNRVVLDLEIITELPNLQGIFITDNNKLETVLFPDKSNYKIDTLYITNSRLSSIPKNISYLQHLERVSFEQNRISDGITELVGLPISKLNLSFNELRVINSKVFSNSTLINLNLSNNKIEEIKYVSENKLSNLEVLLCGNNRLKSFDFHALIIKIKSLDLSLNSLSEVPECIQYFSVLERLILSNNYNLSFLKASLTNLRTLKEISLASLKEMPIEDLDRFLPQIEVLNISYLDLDEFPTSVLKISGLKSLTLDSNNIKNIPLDIANLRNLEYFSIRNNDLEKLPDTLYKMVSLKDINLEYNNFSVEDEKLISEKFKNREIEYGL